MLQILKKYIKYPLGVLGFVLNCFMKACSYLYQQIDVI